MISERNDDSSLQNNAILLNPARNSRMTDTPRRPDQLIPGKHISQLHIRTHVTQGKKTLLLATFPHSQPNQPHSSPSTPLERVEPEDPLVLNRTFPN